MNFWKTMTYRWKEEELRRWTSFKRTVYILFPLLVYFVAHDAAEILLWALTEICIKHSGEKVISILNENAYTLQSIINALAALMGVAAVFPAVRNEIQEQKMNGKETGQKKKEKQPVTYCFLAVFAFCISVGLNIFFYQTGFTGSSHSYDKVYELQYGVQFVIGLFLYGFISPLAEEAVFRGLIYNRMKRCIGYGIALVFSAVLFGAYHGNLVQAVYGSILGFFIAYFYELFKNFAAPVLFHGIANISVYTVTYGGNPDFMSRGIALTTGTILLAASVLIFFYLKKRMSGEK